MFYSSPEKAGISSSNVLKFLKHLDSYNLSTHSVLLARGNDIFLECYYAPFHKDFKHRMYSVTKTFVSVAIGFCEQDGLIDLDEPMVKYFPEYINENTNGKMMQTTIREMLKMETSHETNVNWFYSGTKDRAEVYFRVTGTKNPNCIFAYDSQGSYMLGVIVEKVTGKPFVEYLKDKALRDIGFSEDAYCLKAPGGHSWGDSAMMCSAMDLMLFSRFVLNKGTWNGKRYLNKEYLDAATDTKQVCNNDYGFAGYNHNYNGYGYQIWGMPDGCFGMIGMGGQFSLCDPKHDFIFVITSDNQGDQFMAEHIFDAVYNDLIANLEDKSLPDSEKQKKTLESYVNSRKLFALNGSTVSAFKEEINSKTFICEDNKMGFKWFRLSFEGKKGVLDYENAQGVKSLPFGIGYNEFGKFPQTGYSDLVGSVGVPGHMYDCAVSADFPEKQKLRIRVQIIDKYFGNLAMVFGFKDNRTVTVRMSKCAEAFLDEYQGILNASATENI